MIFFPGCNLRCPWCHNRELVLGGPLGKNGGSPPGGGENLQTEYITPEEALAHLEKRRNLLSGVVLSGGEPTLFPGLGSLISRIKTLGYRVKLDTNGLLPAVLRELFASEDTRPDYTAMDLKLGGSRRSPHGKRRPPLRLGNQPRIPQPPPPRAVLYRRRPPGPLPPGREKPLAPAPLCSGKLPGPGLERRSGSGGIARK